jgi:hypothetical protein
MAGEGRGTRRGGAGRRGHASAREREGGHAELEKERGKEGERGGGSSPRGEGRGRRRDGGMGAARGRGDRARGRGESGGLGRGRLAGWAPQGHGGGGGSNSRAGHGARAGAAGSQGGRGRPSQLGRAPAGPRGGRGEPAGWLGRARKLAQERGGFFLFSIPYFLFPRCIIHQFTQAQTKRCMIWHDAATKENNSRIY